MLLILDEIGRKILFPKDEIVVFSDQLIAINNGTLPKVMLLEQLQ
jgi:hypothetical protein